MTNDHSPTEDARDGESLEQWVECPDCGSQRRRNLLWLDACDCGAEPIPEFLAKLGVRETPPEGFERVLKVRVEGLGRSDRLTRLYTDGRVVLVVGTPDEDDATHNCDFMGCGQWHVLARFIDTSQEMEVPQ